LGLVRFFTPIGGVDGPYPPKPAPYQTLLVGDSPIDLHTARNAGARICVARYGFGYVESAPGELVGDEFFIDHPNELAAVLANGAGNRRRMQT